MNFNNMYSLLAACNTKTRKLLCSFDVHITFLDVKSSKHGKLPYLKTCDNNLRYTISIPYGITQYYCLVYNKILTNLNSINYFSREVFVTEI